MHTADLEELTNFEPGSHVCWIVDDPAVYLDFTAVLLREASAAGEKAFLFGPTDSTPLRELAPLAASAVDPRRAFLGGGSLEPDAMFTMFREQTALARAEGYRGLRVVADMDWLIPASPTGEGIVEFELHLDRAMKAFDATIICAYRSSSFDTRAIAGTLSVHPIACGGDAPQFRLVAGDDDGWRLSGEVDIAVNAEFAAAIDAAARTTRSCQLDVTDLAFIDVAGMNVIAARAQSSSVPVRLVGARPIVRRTWTVAGFADIAPTVEFIN